MALLINTCIAGEGCKCIQVITTTKKKLVSLSTYVVDTDGGGNQACPLHVDVCFLDTSDIVRGDSNTRSSITGITALKLLDFSISGALPVGTLRLRLCD